ncbi:TPA: AEC family transporter [Stenotrophomonas maltophilia]|nr:AEC family transporter [Stenotrophomonas maltophilia]HDS1027997.1 AEC family transporter [Stenotrophomonas maltophilia]HDS1032229.1 AEC family transporter [Stenotrophomonas maltophilia]HDS1033057.1 AEC family transporter [Stenotrophomonas maltophilia]HDS1041096.1 AEC family transporter [Stenotrophomonas maltophilia]
MAFDAFALILAMLGLGMLFARLRALPDTAAETLNKVVLYVCLPAAVLTYVPRLQLDASLLGLMATPWLLMLATWALVSLATRVFGFARDVHAVLLICVALANSSFIGYPMVRALLGDAALPYAVVYDQFGTFLLLSTFGLLVLARYSGDRPPTALQVLGRIARFPPLWALLFALLLMPAQPPAWIGTALKQLADAMLPLVMLAVGLSIQLRLRREELRPLAVGLLLKLLVLPALALPLSWALGMQGLMLKANVLESAMPTMITAAALAISHRLAPRLAAALVGYGIVLSLVTLPAWMWVLG